MKKRQNNNIGDRKDKRLLLKRVLMYINPYRKYVIVSLICAVLSVGAHLLIPIFTGNAIDGMISQGNVDEKAVLLSIAALLITVAISSFATWLMSEMNNKVVFRVSGDLRNEAIEKIQSLPLGYLDSHSSGDLLSRIITDVETLSDGLLMGFSQLFTGVLTIICTLVFMISVNFTIALVVICLTPVSLFVARFISNHTFKYFHEQNRIRGEQTSLINEQIDGIKVVKAFAHEKKSLEEFDEINDRLKKASLKAVFFSSLTNPSTRLVNNIVYAAVGLSGSLFALSGSVTIGQLSVFLSYASQYSKPFNEISEIITELQNSLSCAERIFELLDEKEEIAEKSETITADGNVTLEGVSFRYVPNRPLIEDFSLSVSPGQKIAIVGPTGCGKTTLINLLMRFYDVDSGKITVSGCDIRDVTRLSLRKCYGMVLQDTWLKSGTIRENIAYGKPDATDEEIIAASRASHAHGFIKRLPDGYNTVISENGGNISQGQKQLLCIARVMLCLPSMLILDEATSSIDTRTEMKIQSAFLKMMNGRTSFIVAHRLSTIQEADIILVMKDGHIIEQGKHDELLKQDGFYACLYNSQFEMS